MSNKYLNIIILILISAVFLFISKPGYSQGKPPEPSAAPPSASKVEKIDPAPGAPTPEKKATKSKGTKGSGGNYYSMYRSKSGHRSPQWDEFIEPGFQSFANGNYATAFLFLKQAFDRGCRDGIVLFMMGIFKESQRAYPDAAELLAAAAASITKQYPNSRLSKEIHEHAGRALYQIDDYVRALPELQKALEYAPDNFMLLFMAGQLLRMNKRYGEAKLLFEAALTAKPPAGLEQHARHRLARELMILSFELKDYLSCLSYADQVLAIDPGDATALKYKQRVEQQIHLKQQMEKMEKMLQ